MVHPTLNASATGTEGQRSKKSVNIANTSKPESEWDLIPRYTASKDLRHLSTCVPFYLEKDGYIINDLREDNLNPLCSSSTLSARAPSDNLLSPVELDCRNRSRVRLEIPAPETASAGTSLPKFPFQVEHSLTLEEIQAGLKTITRASNGYDINFSHLDISNKGLIDISLAERFSELKSIDMSCNYIQDIRVLGAMPYLKIVNASKNELEVFGDFRAPVALQQVNFSRNKIFKIINLDKLWALTEVNLSHNNLEIVDGFEQCKNLRVLDLSHNKISSIQNLHCKNLIALFLHNNKIKTIMDLTKCCSLRALSLAQNQIEVLEPLHNLTNLQELWLQSNKITDVHELRHLKTLLKLSTLFVEPNPLNSLGLWRRMLIFTLPQVRSIDGKPVTADESLEATNTFNPSLHKIAHENRMAVLIDRTCQAASQLLDDNIHSKMALPKILLLVGAPMSHAFKLSTLLKEKFKTRVQLGGVHSTVTTLELPNTSKDIPVSFDGFVRMKNKGEFLAYSHILGRGCGFATSQITRAAERNAILVASVPVGIAITLRQWNIRAKTILVMPTGKINIGEIPKDNKSNASPDSLPDKWRPSEPERSDNGAGKDPYWNQNVKRHSKQTIGFMKEKTQYDLDKPGSKRPSLEATPHAGHTILKNKDDDVEDHPDPNLKQKANHLSNVSFKDGGFLAESSASIIQQSAPEENTAKVTNEVVGVETKVDVGMKLPEAVNSVKQSATISAKASKSMLEIFQTLTTENPSNEIPEECSEPIRSQFLTDPKEYPEFSTVRHLQKLRRIASMLMEVTGREKVFEELSSLNVGLDKNVDWKQALTELQLQELSSTEEAYNMLIHRLGPNTNNGIKSQRFFETCLAPPKFEDIATAKDGDLELIFLKNEPDNSKYILKTQSSRFVCADTQGRVIVEKPVTEPTEESAENTGVILDSKMPKISEKSADLSPVTVLQPPKEVDIKSQSNLAYEGIIPTEKTISVSSQGQDTSQTAAACCTVINPNYAFGPHEVCCEEANPHPICCPNELERGTFYQGNFHMNFLESSCSPFSDTSARIEPHPAWAGEEDDDIEGIFEDQCSPDPLATTSEDCSLRVYNGRSGNARGIQQSSGREIPGEYEANSYRQSCPPPPSQNSGSASGREEEEEDILSSDSDKETQAENREHTTRRHREATQACIMNEREKLNKFHEDNPGFFSKVIDSDCIDDCVQDLSTTLEHMMKTSPTRPKAVSYANENRVDAGYFMKQRMSEYRSLAEGFSKGKTVQVVKTLSSLPAKNKDEPTPQFERSRCPEDLFYPFITHKTRMTKIRKIIQL